MRYRPLGASGIAVSVLTHSLTARPGADANTYCELACAALENGINAFEIADPDPAILDGVSEALKAVERRLLFISLRIGNTVDGRRDFSATTIKNTIEAAIARSGLEYFDVAMLDDPKTEEFPPEGLLALKELKREGRINQIGVRGIDSAIEAYILTEAFDILAVPYNMLTGWRERHRMKLAQERDMAVIGYDAYPPELRTRNDVEPIAPVKTGWLSKKPLAPPPKFDAYAFLDETNGWTAEEICLGYSLTEPALASCQVRTADLPHLQRLSDVPDRDLPSGLGSRVEMAKFGESKSQGGAKA